MRLAILAWLGVAFASCTIERDVLTEQITTCTQALAGTAGQACAFDGTCTMPSTNNAMCCTDSAYCRQGHLVVDHSCNPDCTPCTDDTQCQKGAAICNGTVCEPCPNPTCGTQCPIGWVHLQRNGCATCDCAPPSTCTAGPTTTGGCVGAVCYRGGDCATGCNAATAGCCSDQCAAAGCPEPIPVGCLAPCSAAQTGAGCTTCATDHCTCTAGAWKCTIVCANGHHASCLAPAAVVGN
jgi:hypothetical protein